MHDVDRTQFEAYETEEEYASTRRRRERVLGARVGPGQHHRRPLGGHELERRQRDGDAGVRQRAARGVRARMELEAVPRRRVQRRRARHGTFVRSDTGRALTGMAKDVAKQARRRPGASRLLGGGSRSRRARYRLALEGEQPARPGARTATERSAAASATP